MKFRNLFAAVSSFVLSGCTHSDPTDAIPAVHPFSADRYMGTWLEAARLPHRFERGMKYVTAEYTMQKDGTILVRNRGIRDGKEKSITGIARQKKENAGELEVSFFRPFYGAYRVIAWKEDGSAALVTSSTKDYAWILVRNPAAAEEAVPEYTALLNSLGFDVSRLEYPGMRGASPYFPGDKKIPGGDSPSGTLHNP